ncbi:molybdopterin synthase catalytic subunit MoaE [Vibrio profundum]|uniref:molybdopterin synthase catalytic subunit MoaE n=1 Tax=Vibrio profundum TaxID=2910247 RepID=UPI003D0B833F
MAIRISVQTGPFSVGGEYDLLSQNPSAGAVVTFVGKVRDMNLGDHVVGLELEHYPGMTEKSLYSIGGEAVHRWTLTDVTVIHRVGALDVGDDIVFVGVASTHRGEAFTAAEYIMDQLKTRAPFWKKERTKQGSRWIESRCSDTDAAERW